MSTTALQPKKDAQIEQQASEYCYTPRVDIRETTEAIHVQAEMPGVDNKHVDVRLEEGTLTILGRVKRFAKIAGEMVSLAAVEGCAAALWSGHIHAVVSISDARAGERLVLVTECSEANRDALLAYSRANGIAEIMIPKTIHVVDRVPILGTGKIDYVAVAAMVEQAAG